MEVINGYIKGVLFSNAQSQYHVIRVSLDQKKKEQIIVVGYFELPQKDVLYRFSGEFNDHVKYGRQFVVTNIERILPNGKEAMIRFLSSSLFPKVGTKTAEKIIEALGEEALSLIKETPEVLDRVDIKPEQKQSIIKGLNTNTRLEEAMKIFVGHGLSLRTIMKLDAVYKEDMVTIVLNNPYQMIKDIPNISFHYADRIALSLGIAKDDTKRIKAAIIYTVNQISFKYQTTFINYELLVKEFNKMIPLDEKTFNTSFNELVQSKQIVVEEERIYPYELFEAEDGIASILRNFIKRKIYLAHEDEVDGKILQVEKQMNIAYSPEQKEAIKMALKSGFNIITGGPGTGKTTLINALIKVYKSLYPDARISLCAPTGRAAKRISDLTGEQATTIHRLLGWNLDSNVFTHNEANPLEGDLIVVDEFSMVDALLFYNLLKGIGNYQQIILIGDEEQLPPISPGDTLHELLELDFIPRVVLNKIHRQNENSGIVPLAYDIRQGYINHDNLKKDDVVFFNCSVYDVKDIVVILARKALEKGYSPFDIQILAPKYDGIAGITILNEAVRELFNPKTITKKEYQIGRTIYREGDKILQLKNQPDDDVYNGDIGVLEQIILKDEDFNQEVRFIVNFDGNLVSYSSESFVNITHAYCISVHKAQGSEYSVVILPLVFEYNIMLKRKLIYTAITRTKKSLVILGELRAFEHGVKTDIKEKNQSTLKKRIKEKIGL